MYLSTFTGILIVESHDCESWKRNRAAWGWTAKMRVYNRHTHQNDTLDIKVYYSMYHYDSEEEVTVPLRFVNDFTSNVWLVDLDWKLCLKMAADWLMNFSIFESMIFLMKFLTRLSSLHARFESELHHSSWKLNFRQRIFQRYRTWAHHFTQKWK